MNDNEVRCRDQEDEDGCAGADDRNEVIIVKKDSGAEIVDRDKGKKK